MCALVCAFLCLCCHVCLADKEEVRTQLFIMSVEGYLRDFLKLADEVVSSLFSPENAAALKTQLDHDDDGKVCVPVCTGLALCGTVCAGLLFVWALWGLDTVMSACAVVHSWMSHCCSELLCT